MRIQITKDEFLKGLYRTLGIIERRTTHTVLSYILLSTIDNFLRISSTDFDVSYISYIPCNVIEEGKAAVSGKNFYEIIKSLPDVNIEINSLENKWLEIFSGKSDFKVAGIDPDDYPKIEDPEERKWAEFPKDIMLYFIDKTSFCMSEDEARPYLNGVCVKFYEGNENTLGTIMVSTDGKRLSRVKRDLKIEEKNLIGIQGIIHRKGITEIKRFLECKDNTFFISFDETNVILKTEIDKAYLIIKQVEGEYPQWEKVIPEETKWIIIVNKKELIDAVRRVSLISSRVNSMVKIKFEEGQIKISTEGGEEGEAIDYVTIDFKGEEKEIAYNYQYIIQALEAVDGENVKMKIKDENTATVITSVEGDEILQLVMPMRV